MGVDDVGGFEAAHVGTAAVGVCVFDFLDCGQVFFDFKDFTCIGAGGLDEEGGGISDVDFGECRFFGFRLRFGFGRRTGDKHQCRKKKENQK